MRSYALCHFWNCAFAKKEFHKGTIFIHEINNIGMIDRIFSRAIWGWDVLRIDFVSAFNRINLVLRARQPGQAFWKPLAVT